MFSTFRPTSLVLALSSVLSITTASGMVDIAARQDECDGLVYVGSNVLHYPVLVDTYVSANTAIIINGGVTININNAPTSISTVVTATTTVTTTVTPTPTTDLTIGVSLGGTRKSKRAAADGYIGFSSGEALLVTDIYDAAIFSIVDGQLLSEGEYIGADESDVVAGFNAFELFIAPPNVSTTWAGGVGEAITFSNAAFAFGDAEFCISLTGAIFNKYSVDPPFTCDAVLLTGTTVPTPTNSDGVPLPTPKPKYRGKLMKKTEEVEGNVRRGGSFKSPNNK